jgi:hypothetical protein
MEDRRRGDVLVMSQHVLLIPVEGAIHWMHLPDSREAVQAVLHNLGGRGAYVDFALQVDGEESGRLVFLAPVADDEWEENKRAQSALVFLTRTHMRITGNACFIDIDPTLAAVIASGQHERITP